MEAMFWQHVKHRNILALTGVATIAGEFLDTPSRFAFVSPWVEGGSIVKHLMDRPNANKLDLVR